MQSEELSIRELAAKDFIVVNYSDDDIIIIDNIKKLAEPSPTRLRMNLLVIVKSGKAQVRLNERPVTIAANQVLLSPPGAVFNDFLFSPDFEFKVVFLSNRIIQSFLREKMSVWNEVMYVYKMNVVSLRPIDISFFFSFYDALRICIDTPNDGNPYRTEVIQSLLRGAFLGLCGSLKNMLPASSQSASTPVDALFRRFLDIVNKSPLTHRSVEDVASELCVSPKYLSAVCRKLSGKSANEWMREHLLEEIRYYLKNTDMQFKQISDRLGFSNPSFFGKYVKKYFGMTPSALRRKS